MATDECRASFPPVVAAGEGREVRCVHPFAVPASLGESRQITRGSASGSAALSVRGLNAGYGKVQIVRDVSFDVDRGECVAIVGESGSGKTTISRSIGGLHREWTGEVLLEGVPLERAARQRGHGEQAFDAALQLIGEGLLEIDAIVVVVGGGRGHGLRRGELGVFPGIHGRNGGPER